MQFPCKTCNSTRYKIVATGPDPRLNRMTFWGGPETPRTTALQYEVECGRGHRHLYVEELLPSIVLDRLKESSKLPLKN